MSSARDRPAGARFSFPAAVYKHRHNIRFVRPNGFLTELEDNTEKNSLGSSIRNDSTHRNDMEERAKALLVDLQRAKEARLRAAASEISSQQKPARKDPAIDFQRDANLRHQLYAVNKANNSTISRSGSQPVKDNKPPASFVNVHDSRKRGSERMSYASQRYSPALEKSARASFGPGQSHCRMIGNIEGVSCDKNKGLQLSAPNHSNDNIINLKSQNEAKRKGSNVDQRSGRDAMFRIRDPSSATECSAQSTSAHGVVKTFAEPWKRQLAHSIKYFRDSSPGKLTQKTTKYSTETAVQCQFVQHKNTELQQATRHDRLQEWTGHSSADGAKNSRIQYFFDGIHQEPVNSNCVVDRENIDTRADDRYRAGQIRSATVDSNTGTAAREQAARGETMIAKPPMLLKNKTSSNITYVNSGTGFGDNHYRSHSENLQWSHDAHPDRRSYSSRPYETMKYQRPDRHAYDHQQLDGVPRLISTSRNASRYSERADYHEEERSGGKRVYSPVIRYAPDPRQTGGFPDSREQESEPTSTMQGHIIVTYGYDRSQKLLKPGDSQVCREDVLIQVYNTGCFNQERNPYGYTEPGDVHRTIPDEKILIAPSKQTVYAPPQDIKKPEWPEKFIEPPKRNPSKSNSPVARPVPAINENTNFQPARVNQSVEAVSISSHDTEVENDETDSAFSQSDFGGDDDYDDHETNVRNLNLNPGLNPIVSHSATYQLADKRHKGPRLYRFLLELLEQPEKYSCIEWLNKESRIFKFLDSKKVATLWGVRKNKANMKFENFARSLRCYKTRGILKKPRQKLVYQFAEGW